MSCFYEAKTIRVDNTMVPKEPSTTPDLSLIRRKYAGQRCPICEGYGMLRCKECQGGTRSFLGGYQQCTKCYGAGIKPCPACGRRGVIESANHKTPSKKVISKGRKKTAKAVSSV